jgi:hypothetical protein
MLNDQPKELCAGHRSIHPLPCLAVAIAEDHLTVFTGQNILLLNDTPIEITAQIGDRFEQLGAKDLRQRLVAEKITALAPLPAKVSFLD